jgi:tetratricopeptide (TPR) repeat protein
LAGKQLYDADRANQLLDRRVNEWLGNDRKSSYLFGWRDWRLIERNRPYLVWGAQKNHKEALLQQTERKWSWWSGGVAIGALVIQLAIGLFLSPWGQIQVVKWDIARLGRGNDQPTLRVIATGLSSVGDFDHAGQVAARIDHPYDKARALAVVVQAAAQVGDASTAAELLNQAKEVVTLIQYPDSKAATLVYLAQALAQAGDASQAAELLKQATELMKQRIELGAGTNFRLASLLKEVVEAVAQVKDASKATDLLNQAAEIAVRIEGDPFSKAYALEAVTRAAAQVVKATNSTELLDQAAEVAVRIKNPSAAKARALGAVAQAAAQVGDTRKAAELLKQAVEVVARIEAHCNRIFMTTPATKLTYQDYQLLPDDGKRYEILEGELYMTPSPVTRHQLGA